MAKLFNLARMTTATTGTGTITLGSAVSGYLTFALAGVANGDVVSYAIKDGNNSEIGTGTYTSSGTTLTRTVTKSTNSNAAITLSGTAEVFITPRAEDLTVTTAAVQFDMEAATSNAVAVTPGTQKFHPSAAKAWGFITYSGATPTLQASHNVASISAVGTGRLNVTLQTAFSSANYVCVTQSSPSASNDFSSTAVISSASVFNLRHNEGSAATDPVALSFVCFGDQ